MAFSVKSSAAKPTKNRPKEKRERKGRQFAGVERRRASLRSAKGWWRVRELSGLHSDGDPHSHRRRTDFAEFANGIGKG